MSESDEAWLDPDIRALKLSLGEKSGLQVYRNYKNSFERHALEKFRKDLDKETVDLSNLKKVAKLIVEEDVRFLPVIICGYADDALIKAFKNTLPPDVPGGTVEMLNGYGPLADLSKRIRLAFAFDVMSRDLMIDLDKIRSARNRVAHDWDVQVLKDFHLRGRLADITPIESYFPEIANAPDLTRDIFDSSVSFRVRLIWIAGRLTYEANAYHLAKKANLNPSSALYTSKTQWLSDIATVCADATYVFINPEGSKDVSD